MEDAATRRAQRYEERLEQRLLDIERNAAFGGPEAQAKARKDAHRHYRQWGQDLREVSLLLAEGEIGADHHGPLEAKKALLLLRIARVFRVINPN